jgi:hypothetical protein
MVIQPWRLVEQTNHRTAQAQFTATPATRCDPTQQGASVLVSPQQQPGGQTHDDQRGYRKQRKQARPRSDLFDACLGKAQPPLRIPKARLNGMITNDKFCCTRWGTLPLSWWRRPLRLRG